MESSYVELSYVEFAKRSRLTDEETKRSWDRLCDLPGVELVESVGEGEDGYPSAGRRKVRLKMGIIDDI